jgi:hypothetical protein
MPSGIDCDCAVRHRRTPVYPARHYVLATISVLFAGIAGHGADSQTLRSPATPVAGEAARDGLMTPEELNAFASHYYLAPRPDQIDRAIVSLASTGFLRDRSQVFFGFFAEVFATNPDRLPAWRTLIEQQERDARNLLRRAAKHGRPATVVVGVNDFSVGQNDRWWGAFFASGDVVYLQRLASQLPFVDNGWENLYWAGATAQWSLARNLPEHPLVRPTLETLQASADARTRGLIATILAQDLPAIKRGIANAALRRGTRTSAAFAGNYTSITSIGNLSVGSAAGLPPPGTWWQPSTVPTPASPAPR